MYPTAWAFLEGKCQLPEVRLRLRVLRMPINTRYCGHLLSLLAELAAFWMARFVVAAISKRSKGVIPRYLGAKAVMFHSEVKRLRR
jgi:hypothetical protein